MSDPAQPDDELVEPPEDLDVGEDEDQEIRGGAWPSKVEWER